MKYTITEPENDSVTVAAGGAEVHVSVGGNGAIVINVTAPGKLNPKVLALDEDGDASVDFRCKGVHQLGIDLKPTVR